MTRALPLAGLRQGEESLARIAEIAFGAQSSTRHLLRVCLVFPISATMAIAKSSRLMRLSPLEFSISLSRPRRNLPVRWPAGTEAGGEQAVQSRASERW